MENKNTDEPIKVEIVRKWYKTWWGIIGILIFPYILLPLLIWKHTNWGKSGKIVVIVLIELVFLFSLTLLNVSSETAPTVDEAPENTTKTEETSTQEKDQQQAKEEKVEEEVKDTTPGIGQPARDGKFEFIVKSIECGKTSVGTSEFLTQKAQGQFCFLNITVKNIGDEPQSLSDSNQYLFNASGQKYSADSTATLYAAPDNDVWYNEINPGNSVQGAIVFDIPKNQTPTSAELHDSAFSGGIKVNLK